MVAKLRLFGALMGTGLLGGCVSLAIGGASEVAVSASEERGIGGAFNDTVITSTINGLYANSSLKLWHKVDVDVHEGNVLLTGTVQTIDMRLGAVKFAWQVDGVKQVIDHITVGDSEQLGMQSRDGIILAELRSELLFDREVLSINYTTEVVNGTIYLLGVAQSQAELDRVMNRARQIDYVRHVISYVRIKDQKAAIVAPPPAAGSAPLPVASPPSPPPTQSEPAATPAPFEASIPSSKEGAISTETLPPPPPSAATAPVEEPAPPSEPHSSPPLPPQ